MGKLVKLFEAKITSFVNKDTDTINYRVKINDKLGNNIDEIFDKPEDTIKFFASLSESLRKYVIPIKADQPPEKPDCKYEQTECGKK